jgi:hypothetical protein
MPKILLVVFVVLGTLVVLLICNSSLGGIFIGKDGADAVDVGLVLRSPFYWLMVAAIFVIADWLLKLWLHAAKGCAISFGGSSLPYNESGYAPIQESSWHRSTHICLPKSQEHGPTFPLVPRVV